MENSPKNNPDLEVEALPTAENDVGGPRYLRTVIRMHRLQTATNPTADDMARHPSNYKSNNADQEKDDEKTDSKSLNERV